MGGSASAPSYIFEGNTDTGFFHLIQQVQNVRIGVNTSSPISLGGHDGVVTLFGSNATALILKNNTSTSRLAQLGSDLAFFNNTHETERMRLTATGLGIGQTSPATKLDVGGFMRTTLGAVFQGQSNISTGVGLEVGYAGGTSSGFLQAYDRTNSAYKDIRHYGVNHVFYNGGSEVGRFSSSGVSAVGNAAISGNFNTSAGGYQVGGQTVISSSRVLENIDTLVITGQAGGGSVLRLENNSWVAAKDSGGTHRRVLGASSNTLFMGDVDASFTDMYLRAPATMYVQTNNTTALTINSSQSVGIGTTSPEEKLHVAGNVLLDDADPRLYFQTGASHYNWKIAAQDSTNKGFEISGGAADGDANSDTYTPRLVIEADTRYWNRHNKSFT